jgi:signal transduction histidine kinase/CheY-like chemotaxis protein
MNEVVGRALGLYINAAERYKLPVDKLFDGLSIDAQRAPDRFDWETFRQINQRLGAFCEGRVTLESLGELLFEVPQMMRVLAAVQLVASPRMLFWAAHMWATPSAFQTMECDFVDRDAQTVQLRASIREPHQDSPEFFKVTLGIYRALPRLVGLPDAHVELELRPRTATYTVTLPPSLTLWARFRRGAMLLLAPQAVLAELRDQNDELRARFNELGVARLEADRLRLDAERARDVAEAALRVKSDFLATISHELRTPLNGILGLTDMLLATRLDDEQRELAGAVLKSSDTLIGLINDVLDFSKNEAGRLVLDVKEFDPRPVLDQVVQALSITARNKSLQLNLTPDLALPHNVLGDSGRLRQVLLHLVGNALKFTERGSVTVSAAEATRDGTRAVLRFLVRDTGIGIAPDTVAAIFQPFTQVDTSTRRRFGGTGLGLAICKQLVGQMGGEIGVESELGRGSAFWFTVPVGLPAEAPQRLEEASQTVIVAPAAPLIVALHRSLRPPSASPQSLRPPSLRPPSQRPATQRPKSLRPPSLRPRASDPARPWVLLVDDNAVNLKVAAHALKKLNLNVVPATNGVEALEIFPSRSFDAVLMDCQMPEMDGFEATARIRHKEASIAWRTPIIALTANAMEGDRERCLASGMDDYIAKPLKIETLRDTLTRWIGQTTVAAQRARLTSLSPDVIRVGDLTLDPLASS